MPQNVGLASSNLACPTNYPVAFRQIPKYFDGVLTVTVFVNRLTPSLSWWLRATLPCIPIQGLSGLQ
jgi:hypothetical protein